VLPESFPGISFNDDGVCNFCTTHREVEADEAARDRARARFEGFVEDVSVRDGYHCLMALSGGKDSTFALILLKEVYGLNVLAVTFDNGFLSPRAIENAQRVTDTLAVEHIIVRPDVALMKSIFAGVADGDAFSPMALERASSVCNACMGMVKSVILKMAIERSIPAIAYGWSPGQAPPRAAFFKMNSSMIRKMQEARVMPLLEIAGDELKPFLPAEHHIESANLLPYSVNPLAFVDYDEEVILAKISALGWRLPDDTDGNSTNCLLNLFANRNHLNRHGYHPYAFEIAGLVRGGNMSREDGLAKLSDLGDEKVAEDIARSLGLMAE
jgi:tRNA(Ile)-lysidine synthase TilS/MesJ